MAPLRSDSLILTGAASIATRPLLNALLRRRFAAVQLCAELPELADLQTHLSAWCTAQGLPTALRWLAEEPESSFVAPMLPPGWLIHGNTCRAEALLQRNVCTAVRRNIRATAQRLETLPDCGVHLVLLSSHQAAHRSGIAGSTLAAAEALVEAWSASHPAACVQVWRLPAAFDAEQVLAPEPPELNAAWQREALAEAFVDALVAAQPSVWCGGSWRGCGGDEKEFAAGETAKCSFLCSKYASIPICRYRVMLAMASVWGLLSAFAPAPWICALTSWLPDLPFCAVCSEFTRAQGSASVPRHRSRVVPAVAREVAVAP